MASEKTNFGDDLIFPQARKTPNSYSKNNTEKDSQSSNEELTPNQFISDETCQSVIPHLKENEREGLVKDQHKNDHKGARHKCTDCGLTFNQTRSLKRHRQSKHPTEWYDCEICDKRYPTKDSLEAHITWHDTKFKCEYVNCGIYCKTKGHLKRHTESHTVKGPFSCPTCNRVFKSEGKLHAHQQYHATERNFTCDVCEKSYKTADVLNSHKRIHATAFHVYCELCGQGFNQTGSLRRHMDSHNKVKTHTCDVCNTSFSRSQSLQVHKLNANHFTNDTEMHDKTISCSYCGKRFIKTIKYMYEKHMRIHTQETPYQCEICKRQFNDKSNLNAHMKIHTGTKPFKCGSCDKSYIHQSHLHKHIKKHHIEKDGVNRSDVTETTPRNIERKPRKIETRKKVRKGKVIILSKVTDSSKSQKQHNLLTSGQERQVPVCNNSSAHNQLTSLSVIGSMSPLINAATPVNLPLNIVYDTSSILQLASMSAGVVDVPKGYPQRTFSLPSKDAGSILQSSTRLSPDRLQARLVEQQGDVREVENEHWDNVDKEEQEQNSAWKQMNTMFTCKSPKDMDHTTDNWI